MSDPNETGSDRELLVLRVVQLKGSAKAALVEQACGQDVADVLEELIAAGSIRIVRDRYALTPAGRERVRFLLDSEQQRVPRGELADLYEQFVPTNVELKAAASSWQLRADGSLNDHADPTYDEAVLRRIDEVHVRALPVLSSFGRVWPRLAGYGERLVAAAEAIRAGDHTRVLSPFVDSYHQVWFELHEDLLHLLNLSRAEEARSGRAD